MHARVCVIDAKTKVNAINRGPVSRACYVICVMYVFVCVFALCMCVCVFSESVFEPHELSLCIIYALGDDRDDICKCIYGQALTSTQLECILCV